MTTIYLFIFYIPGNEFLHGPHILRPSLGMFISITSSCPSPSSSTSGVASADHLHPFASLTHQLTSPPLLLYPLYFLFTRPPGLQHLSGLVHLHQTCTLAPVPSWPLKIIKGFLVDIIEQRDAAAEKVTLGVVNTRFAHMLLRFVHRCDERPQISWEGRCHSHPLSVQGSADIWL